MLLSPRSEATPSHLLTTCSHDEAAYLVPCRIAFGGCTFSMPARGADGHQVHGHHLYLWCSNAVQMHAHVPTW